MENPFKYGVEVTGEDFTNRKTELLELEREVLSGKSIILYSPRRLGKTSLLMELFRRLKGKTVTVCMKLYGVDSKETFARKIVEQVVAATYTKLEKIKSLLEFLKELRPSIVFTPEGKIKLQIAREISIQSLEEVLDFPERVAEKKARE